MCHLCRAIIHFTKNVSDFLKKTVLGGLLLFLFFYYIINRHEIDGLERFFLSNRMQLNADGSYFIKQ